MIQQEIEICEACEMHAELQERVRAALPADAALSSAAELFKMFGDPTRLRILCVLMTAEVCVCDLSQLLQMTQSAVSHQLRLLKQSKLVRCRREGRSIFYALADAHVRTIIAQGMEHVCEA